MVYTAFNVDCYNLENAISGASALGFAGLNVTAPHKVHVIDFIDKLDITASSVSSINLIKYFKGESIGYNTDIYGILHALRFNGITDIRRATIYGAGGAARSAISALATMGCKQVSIINRTPENAANFVTQIKEKYAIDAFVETKLSCGDIFIQASSATPANLAGVIPKDFEAVFDMNYSKQNTWLDHLKSFNILTFDGLIMLIYQAVKSFEILWNVEVRQDLVDELIDTLKYKNKENDKNGEKN